MFLQEISLFNKIYTLLFISCFRLLYRQYLTSIHLIFKKLKLNTYNQRNFKYIYEYIIKNSIVVNFLSYFHLNFCFTCSKRGGGQFHSVIYVDLRTFFAAKKCATLLHVVTIYTYMCDQTTALNILLNLQLDLLRGIVLTVCWV